jgi:hypothetical protein
VKVKWMIMDAKYLKGKIRIYPMDNRLGKCLCTSFLGWCRPIKHRWSYSPNFYCFRKNHYTAMYLGAHEYIYIYIYISWILVIVYRYGFGYSFLVKVWGVRKWHFATLRSLGDACICLVLGSVYASL